MQAHSKSQIVMVVIVAVGIGAGCASDKAERRQEAYGSPMQGQRLSPSASGVPYTQAAPPAAVPATEGLCSLRLEQRANAEIEADVEQERQSVIVELTTDDQAAVQDLRGQAMELANTRSYRLGSEGQAEALDESESSYGAPAEVPVNVTAQNIEDGARLTFVPTNAGDVEPLQAQLERDADQMEKGNCEVSSAPAVAVP